MQAAGQRKKKEEKGKTGWFILWEQAAVRLI